MAELAVKGCTLTVTPVTVVGKQITTPPSANNIVGDNGIYFGDIQVALSGITQGNYAYAGGTLVVTISGTAENILEGDKPAVQKGDSGEQKKVTLTDSSSGSTINVDIKVEVTDAGQTDVIAL